MFFFISIVVVWVTFNFTSWKIFNCWIVLTVIYQHFFDELTRLPLSFQNTFHLIFKALDLSCFRLWLAPNIHEKGLEVLDMFVNFSPSCSVLNLIEFCEFLCHFTQEIHILFWYLWVNISIALQKTKGLLNQCVDLSLRVIFQRVHFLYAFTWASIEFILIPTDTIMSKKGQQSSTCCFRYLLWLDLFQILFFWSL